MKLQKEPYDCGVYSILNGARALGLSIPVARIRKHADTDETGTNEHGIMNALEKLGFTYEEFKLPKKPAFAQLFSGYPVILNVEDGRHWVTLIGTMGKRVVIFDSWMAKWNAQENGISVLSEQQLMHWWTADENGNRYGIHMWRKK
jgi:ABC-type bacteriocin/lantibiotic exporter with double-glycine peptidase domain